MQRRVFITPLDWGLGHATRCIPVIRQLLDRGVEIHIGGSGDSLSLLRKEFPSLTFVGLPAYSPRYARGKNMIWRMITQLPHFISVIRQEHTATERYVIANNIDLIISDNRYGCWSRKATAVIITHQSNILMPKRFGWLAPVVRRVTESLLNKFDYCWIPDYPDEHSLAGDLVSFGQMKYSGTKDYIGCLSRFEYEPGQDKMYEILAVCSGPEPQRSILEEILLKQLKQSKKNYLLVRGVVEEGTGENTINFMTSDQMREALLQSDIVISRSGYSTVMDLAAMGKKAIFIPTPGQTEQQYLARRLKEKRICFFMEQNVFNLSYALAESKSYTGFEVRENPDLLTPALDRVLLASKLI